MELGDEQHIVEERVHVMRTNPRSLSLLLSSSIGLNWKSGNAPTQHYLLSPQPTAEIMRKSNKKNYKTHNQRHNHSRMLLLYSFSAYYYHSMKTHNQYIPVCLPACVYVQFNLLLYK